MPDRSKKFHEFALKSILFKGRTDWYFCYLKSEKIAHALSLLIEMSDHSQEISERILGEASSLPETIVHFVAGEVDLALVLADIFSLLSAVRLAGTASAISKENSTVLVQEYELLAEKIAAGSRVSPFLSLGDLSIPALPEEATLIAVPPQELALRPIIKDITKGHTKGQKDTTRGGDRASLILGLVRKHKNVSIRDLSAVVTDCSEKTIQRELHSLIERGLVRKEGERRWSIYSAV